MGTCDSKSEQTASVDGAARNRKKSPKRLESMNSVPPNSHPASALSSSGAAPARHSPSPPVGLRTQEEGVSVVLNVYNLQKRAGGGKRTLNECFGLGLYHTGVEVFGTEWAFGGKADSPPHFCGIFPCLPKRALPQYMLKESVVLGHLPLGTRPSRVYAVLKKMGPEWGACTYHLLQRNCNHFSSAFRDALAKEFPEIRLKKFPSYINRAARVADCVVPSSFCSSVGGGARPPGSAVAPPQPPTAAAAAAAAPPHPLGPESDGGGASIPIPATRAAMRAMTVRELKTMMWVNGISWDGCLEKDDLIRAVEAHRQRKP
ncbi:putative desumoylating isopeptidase 2 [Trypanosoma conorhini]|uniref:Putative desumoylating isopeptidase 2 n=1 Tax=Trypanosoma conorhini TaxID=83891 RepID=A0A422Q7Z2_9TRYP|nr:putative desumoylating isopeptidase 2 [Trypanosoma conorhini]RNF26070.1 putative desumoylating isopeptidase 2 [Trypanosoma conorhini]